MPSGHVNSILTSKATVTAHLVEAAAVTIHTRAKFSASAL